MDDGAVVTVPVTDRFLLRGRVALVTGSSRGLGREMVTAFAAAGADVVVTSRTLDACRAVAAEIESETGQAALAHACHVGHWDELDELVDAAYERFGRVDVLVNNAGMSPLYDRVVDVDEELWDKVMSVNLKGAFRLTALVGTRMAGGGAGSIINVSSAAAERPHPAMLPYAAAKAGLNALTKGFAHAFGPDVRVNCIQAGPFHTDISRHWDVDAVEAGLRSRPLQRGAQPQEIVGTALYLASDASSFTTGAVLPVDGGLPL